MPIILVVKQQLVFNQDTDKPALKWRVLAGQSCVYSKTEEPSAETLKMLSRVLSVSKPRSSLGGSDSPF